VIVDASEKRVQKFVRVKAVMKRAGDVPFNDICPKSTFKPHIYALSTKPHPILKKELVSNIGA